VGPNCVKHTENEKGVNLYTMIVSLKYGYELKLRFDKYTYTWHGNTGGHILMMSSLVSDRVRRGFSMRLRPIKQSIIISLIGIQWLIKVDERGFGSGGDGSRSGNAAILILGVSHLIKGRTGGWSRGSCGLGNGDRPSLS
jgi:hypothetical protein